MASSPPKPAAGESYKSQAVSNMMVPIAFAWLFAVGGLLTWDMETKELLERVGKLTVFLAAATAFLTAILGAIQDALPADFKQKLLFPVEAYAYPSYRAFTPEMLARAHRTGYSPTDLDALLADPGRQDELWQKGLETHRGHAAVALFGLRTIAWRDCVPLMILLTVATLLLGRKLGYPGPPEGWDMLAAACAILLAICWFAARHASTGLVVYVVKRIADEKPEAAAPGGGAAGPKP